MKTIRNLIPFHIRKGEDHQFKLRCFEMWQNSWRETFTELGVNKNLSADDFLDREIFGLRTDSYEICGFMLIREFRLGPTTLRHSYFDNYPVNLKEDLIRKNRKAMAISYMTISPHWRKSQTDFPLSEIIMGLCVDYFKNSDCEELYGYFRNNRRTHEIFYRHGGVTLLPEQPIYNVLADISVVTRQRAHLTTWTQVRLENERFLKILKGEKHDIGRTQQLPELSAT